MRIIITGGTGLIGQALVDSLLQDNHEVIILSRHPSRYNIPGAKLVEWDGKTAQGWAHHVDGADAVINFAGAPIDGDGLLPQRWTPERKRLILNSRVNVGEAVVEAIEQAEVKPGVLVQASAVGYYGPRYDEVLTPDSPPGDDFLASVCRQWEASTQPVEAMGVRRVVTRTGVVLSMEGGALPIMALPVKFFVGGPLGNGEQWIPWIHLEDEVRAIRFLMENGEASGAFNLTAPNPLKNKTFVAQIGKVLERPSFFPAPALALKVALGEISTIILDGQRALPQKLQELGFQFKYPQARSALADLLE